MQCQYVSTGEGGWMICVAAFTSGHTTEQVHFWMCGAIAE